jgi:uncharacterized protein YegP (UPF0339 family)
MATATKKARTGTRARRGALVASELAPMHFLISEDNGGDYHWTLLDRNGNRLARSPSFASYQDTENAAGVVLAGAGSARLERSVEIDSPLDMGEGASFSAKAART